jgi:hypothetical protein
MGDIISIGHLENSSLQSIPVVSGMRRRFHIKLENIDCAGLCQAGNTKTGALPSGKRVARRSETVEFRLTTATTATAFAEFADFVLDLQFLSFEIVQQDFVWVGATVFLIDRGIESGMFGLEGSKAIFDAHEHLHMFWTYEPNSKTIGTELKGFVKKI